MDKVRKISVSKTVNCFQIECFLQELSALSQTKTQKVSTDVIMTIINAMEKIHLHLVISSFAEFSSLLRNFFSSKSINIKEKKLPFQVILWVNLAIISSAAVWFYVYFSVNPLSEDQGRKLLSCRHCQELCQLADLASDWLRTLVQPIRSQLAC